MHIRRHTTANYQVTAGQVVVDKKETPLIVSIDDVLHSLDSLAHLNIDTILTNPTGYITTLDSLINNLNPNNLNDTVITDLITILTNLQDIDDSVQLDSNTQNLLNNLINEIRDLFENKTKPNNQDITLYLQNIDTIYYDHNIFKIDTLFYRNGEEIVFPQKNSSVLFKYCRSNFSKLNDSVSHYSFFFYKTFKWIIDDSIVSTDTTFLFDLNKSGNYILKFFLKDTISLPQLNDSIFVKIKVTEYPIVNFYKKDNYFGEYGFEKYEFIEIKDSLECDPIFSKFNYINESHFPIWISLYKNQIATINSEIIVPNFYNNFTIKFESSNSKLVEIIGKYKFLKKDFVIGKNIKEITLKGNGDVFENNFCPIYVKDKNNQIIGQINVQIIDSSKIKPKNLNVVYVKTKKKSFFNINENDLEIYLNKYSYNQGFIRWNLIIDTIELIIPSTFLDTLSNNQVLILKDLLKAMYENAPKSNYLFFIDRFTLALNGEGTCPNNTSLTESQYSFIYLNANLYTCIHEIGHNCSLKHPFRLPNPINIYSTKNFMDYSTIRNSFWRWQLKIIQRVTFKN